MVKGSKRHIHAAIFAARAKQRQEAVNSDGTLTAMHDWVKFAAEAAQELLSEGDMNPVGFEKRVIDRVFRPRVLPTPKIERHGDAY